MASSNKISKIIHQTWKNHDLPEVFKVLSTTWKKRHPDWEYIFWTDEMNRAFIMNNFPNFLSIYDKYPHNIQRVDAVRYFILYEMGGVFIDLDFECLKNIDSLLEGQNCVFGLEPLEHSKRHGKTKIICNAFMACTSRNDFLKAVCEQLQNANLQKETNGHYWEEILESTGPFQLTNIYNTYSKKEGIKLLSSYLLYPLTIAQTRAIKNGEIDINKSIQQRLKKAYGVHYFFGTWWNKNT